MCGYFVWLPYGSGIKQKEISSSKCFEFRMFINLMSIIIVAGFPCQKIEKNLYGFSQLSAKFL